MGVGADPRGVAVIVVCIVKRDGKVAGFLRRDAEGEPRARIDAFDHGGFVINGNDGRAVRRDHAGMTAGCGKLGINDKASSSADALGRG